jgi:ABC-type polysaccharide/polyol phosphate transport system ATPase subunit
LDSESRFAITARDVGIQYDLRLTPDRTLRRTAGEILRRRTNGGTTKFWALRDVNFDVRPGEVLGVIGPNGSGKSTLLLTTAGILRPDRGIVYTTAGAPTLLTLGAGFEADLTGRQNIFLNAAYLGFSRRETRARVDAILEFAELGVFGDAPLRTYSAGMKARLGFSIAAHAEPEILLLDEILGVGDQAFHRKSRQKIKELMAAATAIVVVTHDVAFLREMSTRVLWLEGGRVRAFGGAEDVVSAYLARG